MLPTPWQGRWRKLVESLALSEDVSTRLVELPGLMRRVFHVLVLMGHPVGAAIRGMEAQRKAEEFEYRGWVALLSGLIETFGRAAVKEKFEAEKLWVELQFNPVAIWRYVQDGVPTRAEDDPVRKAWEEAFRYGHEGSPGLPIQSPSLEAE